MHEYFSSFFYTSRGTKENNWWESNNNQENGIHWFNWEKLSIKKQFGGVGFRHLQAFNLVMLEKQGWRLQTNHDTIVSQVLKEKYYSSWNFWMLNLAIIQALYGVVSMFHI